MGRSSLDTTTTIVSAAYGSNPSLSELEDACVASGLVQQTIENKCEPLR